MNRRVALAVLARCGIEPAFAFDGKQAVEAYEKSLSDPLPFTCIFMGAPVHGRKRVPPSRPASELLSAAA